MTAENCSSNHCANLKGNKMKRFLMFILFTALGLSACATRVTTAPTAKAPTVVPTVTPAEIPTLFQTATPESKTLTVFAAASLTNAFEEIGQAFEATNPRVTVKFNFGGSQTLRTQIEQGATADVFASANAKEMDALITSNLVGADTAKLFLTNQLVVVMPAKNPGGLTTLQDLAKPGLKVVLAAKEVPVGNYALQVLDKLDKNFGDGFKDKVLVNVVSYENDVKQVVAKVQLGEADAGIVYTSDVVAASDLMKINIPTENNVVAKYPLAALADSSNADLAQVFIAYVLSPEGQATLQRWGFLPVK
jgi:molybdate transport system substrate-binding protein